MNDTAFQIYVVCSSILVLNLFVLAGLTASTRSKSKKVFNPEDKKLGASAADAEVITEDEGKTARIRRAHLNALENILPFLPMGLVMLFTNPSTAVAGGLFGTFTVFRVLHSIVYVKAMQPARSICFGIALLANVGVVGYTAIRVLTA